MGYVYDCLTLPKREVEYTGSLSLKNHWLEVAANIVVSPRRSGKTTDLIKYSNENLIQTGPVLIAVPYHEMRKPFRQAGYYNIISTLDELYYFWRGHPIDKTHLIVDEFIHIKWLDKLLDYQWKSVTMVSSLTLPKENVG